MTTHPGAIICLLESTSDNLDPEDMDQWHIFPAIWEDGDEDLMALHGIDTGHMIVEEGAVPLGVYDTLAEAEAALMALQPTEIRR